MKQDTRFNIMKNATELFAEKGFSETSISKIAKKAKVGKGTIYWHFNSKEDLFFSIIKEKGETYFNKVTKLINSDKDPEDIIYEYIKERIEFIDNNYNVAKMLINNNELLNRDFKEVMEKKHLEVINVLEKTVKRGIKKGVFRVGNPNEFALMVINATSSAHNNFSCSIKGSSKEKTEKIYNFIMYGLTREEKSNAEK